MKVLLACMNLNGWHGSFLHIREYARYFRSRGDEVHVASAFIDDDNKNVLAADGIDVYNIDQIDTSEPYDIVYALHLLLFPALLLKGLRYRKAITMSLSWSEPIEKFPPPSLWPQFDMLAAISDEIINEYVNKYRLDRKLFTLVPNHIPLDFISMSTKKQEWNSDIKRIAIVSNHYVDEITSLREIAKFDIDYYGKQYGNPVLITPEILLNYDAVISIGKTVQYCMGLGIPIYEYDHFGGCGFITLENFREEGKTNFSGRGTRRKLDSQAMLADLLQTYPIACAQAAGLRKIALKVYGIDRIIENQIKTINSRNLPRPKLNVEARLFCNAAFAAMSYIFKSHREQD